MPKGITRAADRVAVWHEAADDKPLIFNYMPDDDDSGVQAEAYPGEIDGPVQGEMTPAEKLYFLAQSWGVDHPERYGLPRQGVPVRQGRVQQPPAPVRGTEFRRPHGIVTVHERYL